MSKKAKSVSHAERRERRRKIAEAAQRAGVAAAAQRFGASYQAVWAACRECGIDPKPVPRDVKSSPRVLAILAAVQAGERQIDVARRFGVTRQAVSALVIRAREAGLVVEKVEP